jgi:hypothetical protein
MAPLPRTRRCPYRVGVVGVYRHDVLMRAAVDELRSSHHCVDFALGAMAAGSVRLAAETVYEQMAGGKFQNLNELLPFVDGVDWLLIVDDDVTLPSHFLERFLMVCERLNFAVAQPAQSRRSYANWGVTRRRFLSVARETKFVEIGPVTAMRRDARPLLTPFPPTLRWGWGLDFHWAWVLQERGFAMGVVDASAVEHRSRPIASTYSRDAAQQEGLAFAETVPRLHHDVASVSVRTYRSLPRAIWTQIRAHDAQPQGYSRPTLGAIGRVVARITEARPRACGRRGHPACGR